MRRFLKKVLVCFAVFLVLAEMISRVLIDPVYFYKNDTYRIKEPNLKLGIYSRRDTEHVDYLFIGTSRVPATINPEVIMRDDTSKITIVAGRGYATAGTHYQALKSKLSEFPDYLKDALVLIEYPGSSIYEKDFQDDRLFVHEPTSPSEKAMPHILLPYLKVSSLITFIKESKNSTPVKFKMAMLFLFSSYRSIAFVREMINRLNNPLFAQSDIQLATEGGIRNDFIGKAKQLAIRDAENSIKDIEMKPILTFSKLNKSSLAYFNQIVIDNGGRLFLYKMPLHSTQEKIYNSNKALQNQKIFEDWISSKGIQVIYIDKFKYQDIDFPDTWHLSKERRDEFTLLLYEEIVELQTEIRLYKE